MRAYACVFAEGRCREMKGEWPWARVLGLVSRVRGRAPISRYLILSRGCANVHCSRRERCVRVNVMYERKALPAAAGGVGGKKKKKELSEREQRECPGRTGRQAGNERGSGRAPSTAASTAAQPTHTLRTGASERASAGEREESSVELANTAAAAAAAANGSPKMAGERCRGRRPP